MRDNTLVIINHKLLFSLLFQQPRLIVQGLKYRKQAGAAKVTGLIVARTLPGSFKKRTRDV